MDGPEAPSRGGAAPWLIALAAVAAGAAAALVLTERPTLAGVAAAVAGGALIYADLRAVGRLRFAHAVVERAVDGVILGAVAWEFVESDTFVSAGALTALGFAYLAAYLRAKGRGLGFRVSDPALERYVHFALVSGSLLLPSGPPLLWLAAAVDAQATFRTAVAVGRQREA